jgi:hypothetical protein
MTFRQASRIERTGEHLFRAEIPDGWQQGRGAFGGLVLGVAVRGMVATEPERVLRALTADIAAPVLPGEVRIAVEIARRGKNQTNLVAAVDQAGARVATLVGVMSNARDVTARPFTPEAPCPAPWEDVAILPVAPPFGPRFAPHYEYRPTGPGTAGYVREKSSDEIDSAALVALLDAWWPTLFAHESAPRPVATISFAAQLFASRLPGTEPLFHTARLVTSQEGFFVELRELWSGDRLVALNQQTMAILG